MIYRLLLLLLPLLSTTAQSTPIADTTSPLSGFSPVWNKEQYRICNTAAAATYLSEKEKKVIYIINLARQHPQFFLESVVKKYPAFDEEEALWQSSYFTSLISYLQKKSPQPLLYPNEKLFMSARCHAITSGEAGYVGHNRRTQACRKLEAFLGECCDYGSEDPLSIVMSLMIDEDVPSLGHRLILFSPYTKLSVSIQPHTKWRWNAVLDFE